MTLIQRNHSTVTVHIASAGDECCTLSRRWVRTLRGSSRRQRPVPVTVASARLLIMRDVTHRRDSLRGKTPPYCLCVSSDQPYRQEGPLRSSRSLESTGPVNVSDTAGVSGKRARARRHRAASRPSRPSAVLGGGGMIGVDPTGRRRHHTQALPPSRGSEPAPPRAATRRH